MARRSSRAQASSSRRCGSSTIPIELEPWLVRTGCTGADADTARELLADRMDDGFFRLDRIALRARPA